MFSPTGFLKGRGRVGAQRDCDARRSTAADAPFELPDLLSISAPSGDTISPNTARSALKFVSLLAFSPWLAYLLLGLVTTPESAWAFVSSCLWIGTPILVICSGLFALDRGRQGANT